MARASADLYAYAARHREEHRLKASTHADQSISSFYGTKTAALAAGGQSRNIPDVYKQAVKSLGPAPDAKQSPIANWQDDLPRRRVVRKLRETLVKSTILVGVAHCIEASWVLSGALEEGDKVGIFLDSSDRSRQTLMQDWTVAKGRHLCTRRLRQRR